MVVAFIYRNIFTKFNMFCLNSMKIFAQQVVPVSFAINFKCLFSKGIVLFEENVKVVASFVDEHLYKLKFFVLQYFLLSAISGCLSLS